MLSPSLVILSPFASLRVNSAKNLRSLFAQGKLREASPQFADRNNCRDPSLHSR